MENFSILPRLLRDSVIFEAWEGAHNTLLAQSVRDIGRHRLDGVFCSVLTDWFNAINDADWRDRALEQIENLRADLIAMLSFPEDSAGVAFKPLAERMMWLFYLACLGRECSWEEEHDRSIGKRACIEWLWRRKIEDSSLKDISGYVTQLAQISAAL
jgi:hypothetical protein